MKWLKVQLIPNLDSQSLIVLDNASYHSRILNKQPTSSWRKSDIYEWLEKHNQICLNRNSYQWQSLLKNPKYTR